MRKYLVFSLILVASICLWAQNTPVTVTAPNGGESWQVGTTHHITWTVTNLTGSVIIQLRRGAQNQEYLTLAQNIPATQGLFIWNIPTTVTAGSEYKIRIALATSAGTTLQDYSDGYFSITTNGNTYSLTVVAPNGGETWLRGTAHEISWTSSNLTGNVRISLIRSVTDEQITLAESVPVDAGVFVWNIPAEFPLATDYRVHIVWLTMLTIYVGDMSDGTFTVFADTPPPPATVTVVAPNGGEVWNLGSAHTIQWNYVTPANVPGPVQIAILGADNSTEPAFIIAPEAPNVGSFIWTPVNLPVGDNYRIRIRSVANPDVCDISDGCFSLITNTLPSLTVVSPNGGEIWVKGTTHSIVWNWLNVSGNVMLQLFGAESTVPVLTMAQSIPVASGHFEWNIPATVPVGSQYKVRVTLVNTTGLTLCDFSDGPFTIAEANPNPLIQVISPNGGEQWAIGGSYPIVWTSAMLAGNFEIALMRNDNMTTPYLVLAPSQNNLLQFVWTIPETVPVGNNYKVRVRNVANNDMGDLSDGFFSIVSGNTQPAVLTVTSPNGGETWAKGSTHAITWTSQNIIGPVQIALVRSNATTTRLYYIVAREAPNTGSFQWTIPMQILSGNRFRILIRSRGINAVHDMSDGNFSIVENAIDLRMTPNPTKADTDVRIETEFPTFVSVRLYNLKGELIKVLAENQMVENNLSLQWDGRDRYGRTVSNGVYLMKVDTPERQLSKRLVICK